MKALRTKQKLSIHSDANIFTYLAFVIVVLIGGSNAVAVHFSNLELPPFWGAALRFGSASLLFWIAVLLQRIEIPKGRSLLGATILGVLTIGIAYALLYWALVSVAPSMVMLILSLGPLLTFLAAVVHGQEGFHWRGLLGAIAAMAGILVVVGNPSGGALPTLPLVAILVAAAVIAEGTVLYKSFPKANPIAVNAVSLTTGTFILLLVSLITGETRVLPTTSQTWIAYGYLVLVGSTIFFYLYLYILDRWSASATAYTLLLFPVATIVISSWLADEVIALRFMAGTAIVLFGVWLGAIRQPRELAKGM